jgi:hypothetical protein
MKTFTRVNVLDLNNPGGPPTHRVNGRNAEPAITNEPWRDSLGHTDVTYFTFGASAPEWHASCSRSNCRIWPSGDRSPDYFATRWTKRVVLEHAIRQVVSFAMPKTRTRRYSIEIKDAECRSVLFTVADWDEDDRRAAVAQILRLDGVLEVYDFAKPSLEPKRSKK